MIILCKTMSSLQNYEILQNWYQQNQNNNTRLFSKKIIEKQRTILLAKRIMFGNNQYIIPMNI